MIVLTVVTAGISLIAIVVSMLSISNNNSLFLHSQQPTTIILYVLLFAAFIFFMWGAWTGEIVRSFVKKMKKRITQTFHS